MDHMQAWELLSYIVTVFGLPLAIFIFIYEKQRERENEEEEIYLLLSDAYTDFLKLVIANPDLKLRSQSAPVNYTDEQQERAQVIFEMLIALFERAYILQYEDNLTANKLRRWLSWEDFMREWCRRDDFRNLLPKMLEGEDADFAAYIQKVAQEENARLARNTVQAARAR